MYKCFSEDFEKLTKKINRITKKLDKYNIKWHFEKLNKTVEEITIYKDNKKVGTTPKDVTHYIFTMDSLKLGEYEVIAIIEHNAIANQKGNVIHQLKQDIDIPIKYRTAKSLCEHCNSNRRRNKTLLITDKTGNIKQVGTSCVKEYTGIDAADIIRAYEDISDIYLEDYNLSIDYNDFSDHKYILTVDYLTACIDILSKKPYYKNLKIDAWNIAKDKNYKPELKHIQKAKQIIEFFKNNEFEDNFLWNVKMLLTNEYSKPTGYIAYTPIAYQRHLEYIAKKEAEAQQKAKSQYQGNIKDKIEIEVTLDKIIIYETIYGMKRIYLFKDNVGNIYKWNTTVYIKEDEGDQLKLKGTIKNHTEYDGEKQTELTRCKVIS